MAAAGIDGDDTAIFLISHRRGINILRARYRRRRAFKEGDGNLHLFRRRLSLNVLVSGPVLFLVTGPF